jgi:hypothetical protein
MSFTVKSSPNNKKIFIGIEGMAQKNGRSIRRGFYFAGKDITDNARNSILRKPKSGRTYIIRKGGRRFNHKASAPGEAPANLSGALRRSIDFKVQGWSDLEVGADTPYARRLELGGGNIEARPYLITAIEEEERNTRKHLEREIQKGMSER